MTGTITLESVTKHFPGGVVAVNDLSLEVEPGEFLVLVGPSGCGKTTALRMVAGLEPVTSGQIRINDRLVTKLPPRDRDIAMVFQNYALYAHMSVRGNMAFGLKMARVKKQEIRRRVDEAAAMLGRVSCSTKPRQLFGGQRQRWRWAARSCATRRVPDRRAVLHSRCPGCASRCAARSSGAAPHRRSHAVCDARSGPRRCRSATAWRSCATACCSSSAGRPDLRPPGQRVRGGIHRLAVDEPDHGQAGRLVGAVRQLTPAAAGGCAGRPPRQGDRARHPARGHHGGRGRCARVDHPPGRVAGSELVAYLDSGLPGVEIAAGLERRTDVEAGRPVRLAVDLERLYFFDPTSGEAIG